jgi:hypothetical protein
MDLVASNHRLPECELCPTNTFKSTAGDDYLSCKPCDLRYSVSSEDRIACKCTQILGPGKINFFNVSLGECLVISENLLPFLDDAQYETNTALTRYKQLPCESGHFCVDGTRHQCPSGR